LPTESARINGSGASSLIRDSVTGGSCFPKDVAAFIATSEALGVPFSLLKEVDRINQNQRARFLKKIKDRLWVLRGKKITVWGLAFKPDTDDIRSSVAIEVVRDLVAEGAIVSVYDPKGLENFTRTDLGAKTVSFTDPLKAVRDADALVLATEWPEFRDADFTLIKELMHSPIIFDGRNHLDRDMLVEMGFDYFGVGR
jgi:UDPglucose 6-dehydrogenase